jgi:pyruvate formate lyase activating enzyme
MKIAGWQKVSMVDYPGKIATVLFTPGCNFNCYYCHNRELIHPTDSLIGMDEEEVLSYIYKRKGMIDALVLSGGEPTLQKGMAEFIEKAKSTGILIKLDTNGSRPDVIKDLLDRRLLDFVAMDIKAPFHKLMQIIGISADQSKINESIRIIMDQAPDYEFRTTVSPDLTKQDLLDMASLIKGAKSYALQQYKRPECDYNDSRLDTEPHEFGFFTECKALLEAFVKKVEIRGF